jgi:hypothetical protein
MRSKTRKKVPLQNMCQNRNPQPLADRKKSRGRIVPQISPVNGLVVGPRVADNDLVRLSHHERSAGSDIGSIGRVTRRGRLRGSKWKKQRM